MRRKSKKQTLTDVSDILLNEIKMTLEFLQSVRIGEVTGEDLKHRLNAAEFVFSKALQFHEKYSWAEERVKGNSKKEDTFKIISIIDAEKRRKSR